MVSASGPARSEPTTAGMVPDESRGVGLVAHEYFAGVTVLSTATYLFALKRPMESYGSRVSPYGSKLLWHPLHGDVFERWSASWRSSPCIIAALAKASAGGPGISP